MVEVELHKIPEPPKKSEIQKKYRGLFECPPNIEAESLVRLQNVRKNLVKEHKKRFEYNIYKSKIDQNHPKQLCVVRRPQKDKRVR